MSLEVTEKDQKELKRLEEELWTSETRFDRAYMEEIMAPDFFEFGRSGHVYDIEQILSHESDKIVAVIPLPNLKIRLLTEDVAQVTYYSEATFDGIVEKARRSSIWTRSGESWKLRFHQGTTYYDENT